MIEVQVIEALAIETRWIEATIEGKIEVSTEEIVAPIGQALTEVVMGLCRAVVTHAHLLPPITDLHSKEGACDREADRDLRLVIHCLRALACPTLVSQLRLNFSSLLIKIIFVIMIIVGHSTVAFSFLICRFAVPSLHYCSAPFYVYLF